MVVDVVSKSMPKFELSKSLQKSRSMLDVAFCLAFWFMTTKSLLNFDYSKVTF